MKTMSGQHCWVNLVFDRLYFNLLVDFRFLVNSGEFVNLRYPLTASIAIDTAHLR